MISCADVFLYRRGTQTYANNETYDGEFNAKGGKHGQGLYKWNSSNSYQGSFFDDKSKWEFWIIDSSYDIFLLECGLGVLSYSNGDKYEGSFLNEKKVLLITFLYFFA